MSDSPLQLSLDLDGDRYNKFLVYGSHLLCYGGDDGILVTADNKPVRGWDNEALRSIDISQDGKRVLVGLEGGSTRVYAYNDYVKGEDHPFCTPLSSLDDVPKEERPGEIVWAGPSMDTPVRDVRFYDRYHAAIASETGLILVDCSLESSLAASHGLDITSQAHDEDGVRSVTSWKQHGKTLLCSLGMNGRVCVFEVNKLVLTQVYRDQTPLVPLVDKGEMFDAPAWIRALRPEFVAPCWLLFPGSPNCLVMKVNEGDFETMKVNSSAVHGDYIVCCKAQHDGHGGFVTAGRDGRVLSWNIKEVADTGAVQLIPVHQWAPLETGATDIAQLRTPSFVIDSKAKLYTLKEPDQEWNRKTNTWDSLSVAKLDKKDQTNKKKSLTRMDLGKADFPSDSESEKEKNDRGVQGGSKSKYLDFEVAVDDDSIDLLERADMDDAELSSNDDDDAILPRSRHRNNDESDDDDGINSTTKAGFHGVQRYTMSTSKAVQPQPAFAPSSTPLDLDRRYLCWNHLGSITLLRGERSVVNIDFTNSAFRRPVSFTNKMGFILGSLGADGAIFATDLSEEDDDEDFDMGEGLDDVVDKLSATKAALKKSQRKQARIKTGKSNGSNLYFYRFETFASNRDKDWFITLPDGERALGCACGQGWAAVITSRRFLRLYTSGGNQDHIIWLPGEPVTMAGRDQFLIVAYHDSTPLPDETQKLGYMLVDTANGSIISKGPLSAISSGSSLMWLGLSNDSLALSMDSDGMLSMLVCMNDSETSAHANWEWVPVLDTVGLRKSTDDCFWPITLFDGKLVCVPLKGGTKYPDAARRPVTSTLALRLPMARSSVAQSDTLQELSARANMVLKQKKVINDITCGGLDDEKFENEYLQMTAQVDKVTLKMFSMLLEVNKQERALDLVDNLNLEKSFDLAMALASQHRTLVELIEDAKSRKYSQVDEYEDDASDNDLPVLNDHVTSHRNISPDGGQTRKRENTSEPILLRSVRNRFN